MDPLIEAFNNWMGTWAGRFENKTFADGICHSIGAFGNVGVVETDEGLVLFDVASKSFGQFGFKAVREFSDKPIKYIIYSHGHTDHCLGFAPYIEEIKEKGWEMPEVIAHENCLKRFEKYKMLYNHQHWTYFQQTAALGIKLNLETWQDILTPTIIFRGNENYEFKLGNCTFELYHDKGETDGSLWMFFPEKKVLFGGDLMVSSYPNIGSPFRVQRYPKDWAIAMEKMMEKNAEYMVPGHGQLIEGKDEVREALSITAEALYFVHDEVVKRLNEGKWFEQIYYEVLEIYPEKFKNHKYLKPIYGDIRFAIHCTYRLHHGWYNTGNPTDLFPAKSEDIAKEFLKVNSEENYFDHAKHLYEEGKLQLALHIIDVVIKGTDPNNREILLDALRFKRIILKQMVKEEESFVTRGFIDSSAYQMKDQIRKLRRKKK